MSNGNLKIALKPAHAELQKLIEQLDRVDDSQLRPNRRDATTTTPEAWKTALRNAKLALEEWCPNPGPGENQFGLEAPLKR